MLVPPTARGWALKTLRSLALPNSRGWQRSALPLQKKNMTSHAVSKFSNQSLELPETIQMLLLHQDQSANKLLETSRYVSKGFERSVGSWLLGTASLVASIVCLGGYTRLTESGLAITDWKVQGSRYPQTDNEWEIEFAKYKKTLEYREVHYGMSLDEFKFIYFNEWIHRMVARGTGLFFGGGAVYYGVIKRVFTPRMFLTTSGLLALFTLQGLIGWWMVKSGFEERTEEIKTPRVSPYRLATHLAAAAILFSCLVWSSLNILMPPSSIHLTVASCAAAFNARKVAAFLFPFAPITFMSGAFVAGNDAGRAYNTWPKMIDRWVPKEFYDISSNWKHLFENDSVVQFDHRILAYTTLVANGAWYLYCRRLPLSPKPRKFAQLMAHTSLLQIVLGVANLLMYVPVSLGVLHQALGLGVISVSLLSAHTLRTPMWYLHLLKR